MRAIIDPMRGKRSGSVASVAVALLLCAIAACRDQAPPPVAVEDRVVKVHNQTSERWTEVRVWLNDHYVAGTPVLEPDGRLTVQQRDFIAAMGQKFDPNRQSPYGVLVTAKSPAGDVTLVWGRPYRKQ
jgi:hypothetical protein